MSTYPHQRFPSRLCVVVSSPMTANTFLTGHLLALSQLHSVDLVCNVEDGGISDQLKEIINVKPIAIRRKLSLVADVLALVGLYRNYFVHRYCAVISVTPKAGLLSLIAAFLSRTPVRVHIFTGQVWVTRTGVQRHLLKRIDKLMAYLATDLLADSPSQRDFLIAEGVVHPDKIKVLASGSICGFDEARFMPCLEFRMQVRRELQIPDDGVVVLFLGRMTRDKGILDLAQAFAELALTQAELWLVAVGPDEDNLQKKVAEICAPVSSRVRLVGFTQSPERFMAAADIFALPSYREGFGSSVIEAAACGLPSLCSEIYGLTDAVVNGVTGLLHKPADIEGIKRGLEKFTDSELRKTFGVAARARSIEKFTQQRLTDALCNFVHSCINNGAEH